MSTKHPISLRTIKKARDYIQKSWGDLLRTHKQILQAMSDPKLPASHNERKILYISQSETLSSVKSQLKNCLTQSVFEQINIEVLPDNPDKIKWHGLLYLPQPYVVPGGRFNEMYGWDSYFIILGLIRDNLVDIAKGMVENALYQIEHYGKVLNSNRSYHLDRSQPPLISQMVLAIYRQTCDREWLAQAIKSIEKDHRFWNSAPHLIESIGMSRYCAQSNKPSLEVIHSEIDETGRDHYERIRAYFKTHHVQDYRISKYYDKKRDTLRPSFYMADRSARESGFDPSNKYGPFGGGTPSYASICLNSLLYQMEQDLAEIHQILGNQTSRNEWNECAIQRSIAVNRYCWDEDLGYYFDYDADRKIMRPYIFATTFYPLWAGIASQDRAQQVIRNLVALEAPGGLLASTYVTGNQWDAPFGWAPFHYFAVKALKRYGYHAEAERLSYKFINLVNHEFEQHGSIFEKYDVSSESSEVKANIKFGYQSNEIGFGWTNAVYLELLDFLESD
ncbi:MAG: neutral trehalase [Gammaproteobacteria bacterium]|jgi:alpha,alpha-trehalase|nr:neutral trehalase [Gammaproteobacteria bacterium]